MKALHLSLATSLLLALAGCTTTGGIESAPPVEERDAASASGAAAGADRFEEGVQASGAAGAAGFEGDSLDDPASLLSQRVVYFEFDSSELSQQDQDILRAHAEYLAAHPERRVVVEGHTDERGSREYNLALGERRADSVKRILVLGGASPDQVEAVSFGEEQPAVVGSNEEAWRQNRRAELNYTR